MPLLLLLFFCGPIGKALLLLLIFGMMLSGLVNMIFKNNSNTDSNHANDVVNSKAKKELKKRVIDKSKIDRMPKN